ncbi:MAG: ABC transporter permease [Micromonosporaceae bacterium]|nr:ABC transporter permease [Micromonosporaceae bacterium]
MFRATLKSLLSRKLRLTLAGLAVVLGVMFVSGSFVLTETLKGSFDSLFTSAYSSIDVAVEAKADTPAEETGQIAATVPASVVTSIRALPGVAAVVPTVEVDGARLIGSDGKVVTTMGAPRFGSNWSGEDSFIQLREGRGPQADNEIAINAGLAKAADVHVGDQVQVITRQPKQAFTLVGIFGYAGGKDTMSSAHQVAFTTPVAQELMLGERNVFSSISVNAAEGVSDEELRDTIKAAVGAEYDVRTREELEQHSEDQYASGLDFFNKILLGFAAVALFVGTFLIINTFSIIIAQRTRELALLRAIGANRRQIIGSVLVEATAVGVVASSLGLASGIGVGALLGWVFGLLTDLSTAGTRVPIAAVVSAFAVGIPITLFAALLPALRAARIPPVAAMQEAATADRPLTKLTWSGALVTAIGVTLLGLGLRGSDAPLALIGGGVLVSFVGVALLTPSLARPIGGGVGRLLSWSVPGRLGRLNSRRNPRRTAITAAALMVGVALITGMSVIVSSVNSTLHEIAKKDIKADLLVSGDWNGSGPRPTFDASILERTAQVDGVTRVIGEYDDFAEVTVGRSEPQGDYTMAFTDLPGAVDLWSMKTVSGDLSALSDNQALIDDDRAEHFGLKVGDTATVALGTGSSHTMTISGIYRCDLMEGWVVPASLINEFAQTDPMYSSIELAQGVSSSKVKAEINALFADYPEISVSSVADLVDEATSSLDQVLLMIQILLGLAILIAILGIINTLALSIIERTRELGMLRAIGLRRAQLMRMIAVESVIISVFGAILGLTVGSGLGVAIVKALESEGITTMSLPWGDMATYLIVAAIVGVIAAAIPAIRAMRINVLAAIATE